MWELAKKFAVHMWTLVVAVSVLLTLLALKPAVRISPKAVGNWYAVMIDVSNEGVFSLRDVNVGCVVHFWIPNEKSLYEPGLGSKETRDSDMAEKIEPAAGHSFVCNFSDAKEQLAAEPAQVSPPTYVAEVTVSYRPLLGFRRYKKANFGTLRTRDGHMDWLKL
jgi:hypothetical protein